MSLQKFGTIVKPAKIGRRMQPKEIDYLKLRDRQMRFNNAQDPIYYIFDCIENRPVSKLATEFVKDSIFEAVNFISKVVG